jgi:hypothetical protein
MGFITESADSILKVCFTSKGMEHIANGKSNKLIVKYFALGDCDTNYLSEKRLCTIPDITGVEEAERGFIVGCDPDTLTPNTTSYIIPTIQSDIKYKINLTGDTSVTPRELTDDDSCC